MVGRKKGATKPQAGLSIRIPETTHERIKALAALMTAKVGVEINASAVHRAALERGLDEMEREHSRKK